MDIDAFRDRFILCAFRNYFQWFENRIPEAEKPAILGQLARLEEAYQPVSKAETAC
jgi:hypothetical protein